MESINIRIGVEEPNDPRFVEIEDENGAGVKVGRFTQSVEDAKNLQMVLEIRPADIIAMPIVAIVGAPRLSPEVSRISREFGLDGWIALTPTPVHYSPLYGSEPRPAHLVDQEQLLMMAKMSAANLVVFVWDDLRGFDPKTTELWKFALDRDMNILYIAELSDLLEWFEMKDDLVENSDFTPFDIGFPQQLTPSLERFEAIRAAKTAGRARFNARLQQPIDGAELVEGFLDGVKQPVPNRAERRHSKPTPYSDRVEKIASGGPVDSASHSVSSQSGLQSFRPNVEIDSAKLHGTGAAEAFGRLRDHFDRVEDKHRDGF